MTEALVVGNVHSPAIPAGVLIRNTLIVALAGLLFGYDTGVISGSQMYFTEHFSFSPAEQGWAVGSALYGCLLGALVSGFTTHRLGRRMALMVAALLFIVSAWGSGAAEGLASMAGFRLIGGVGVGLASMAAPMYIAEISPAAWRGRMVTLYQLAVVVGFFVVFLANYAIGGGDASLLSDAERALLHQHNLETGWRLMLWSELPVAAIFLGLLFFVPESPRWLAMRGQRAEAKAVLVSIAGDELAANRELTAVEADLAAAPEQRLSLWRGPLRLALLVGIGLSVFQQITGINAILYYGAEIFSQSLGYGPEDALKQQLWLGGVNLVCTFVAIAGIDRWGRRPLLLVGLLGMMLGLCVLAWTLLQGQVGGMSLMGVLVFIGAFALSMGPVVWVLLSEIFPNSIRAQALSIAVAAQWLFNALVAQAFPLINRAAINDTWFNGSLPYWLFAGFCLLGLLAALRWVPETKGKSLEQMQQIWRP